MKQRRSAEAIASRKAKVNGSKLHYVTAGRGDAVILLHGYTQTSRMWRSLIPLLAERFMVIAPDLPGIGASHIPRGEIDMASAAVRIHALAESLGVTKARVVGHDIGLMVAYAFLPGVEGWEAVYNNPGFWHFHFNGPTPEALVRGRERTYFEHFWNDFAADKKRSIPAADRKVYAATYARPGRMRSAWQYFVSFQKTARGFADLARHRLTMPVLAIGGARALGEVLARQMQLVATDVAVVVLKDCGHWVLEERPKETTEALLRFL